VPVTVLIEGEEEGGGEAALSQFIAEHQDLLAADVAIVCDSGVWDGPAGPIPAITYGLRGIVYYDLRLFGPNRDLHSGAFGGSIPNPATLLARVIGRLLDEDNHITVPGFYDDVLPATDQEKRLWSQLPCDEQRALAQLGLSRRFGERGRSSFECLWARPTCDVSGLLGGYQGQGAKTIIPSWAGAKISFRLVPNQDPVKIDQLFRAWMRSQDVGGCRWEISQLGNAWPVLVPTDSPFVAAAQRALQRAAGQVPVLIREGGTIPVVADIQKLLGLNSLLIGFGRADDCIHSPNEKFDLAQFDLGCRALATLLADLAL
jgi:acetylornithine deacetylase/succinyl-diaminopimelate desuccinylase-like protein